MSTMLMLPNLKTGIEKPGFENSCDENYVVKKFRLALIFSK
jgi:hypothetical protein